MTTRGGLGTLSLQGLLAGITLGVTLGILLVHFLDLDCEPDVNVVLRSVTSHLSPLGSEEGQRPRTKRGLPPPPPFLRPRYVSTELGLRRKLLVGVVLSDSSGIGLARLLRLNQTLSHTVDKVIYFVNGTTGEVNGTVQQLRSSGLSGIVPIEVKGGNWTGNVHWLTHHVTLRGLKYFGDKFRNSFDYFYITTERGYVSGRNLMESLKQISVREQVLWGIPRTTFQISHNSSCNLDSGFVVSRNILSFLWNRIGRCWSTGLLRDKLGGDLHECLEHVAPGQKCRTTIQDQVYKAVPTGKQPLEGVIFVGPVSNPNNILEIHRAFCWTRKLEIDSEIEKFRKVMVGLDPSIPEKWRRLSWPVGLPPPIPPKTRFDVNRWTYFTLSTIYFQNDDSTATPLAPGGIEYLDLTNILTASKHLLKEESHGERPSPKDEIPVFQYGYKRFSPTRGMEYILNFDLSGKPVRIEGLRPLTGTIEIVPVPFTTEGKRLSLIVPITRENMDGLSRFLDFWSRTATDSRQNSTSLLITILQGVNSPNSLLLGPNEAEILRDLITSYNNGSESKGKVGFAIVSLRNTTHLQLGILEHFGHGGLLLPSSLVVFLEPNVEFQDEFLNRVRMNTIPGYQCFCPIPFMEYHPGVAEFSGGQQPLTSRGEPDWVEVKKESGYFNSKELRVLSFYYSDFLEGVKSLGDKLSGFLESVDDRKTLPDIFIHGTTLHVFRGTEPSLTLRSRNGTHNKHNSQMDLENNSNEPLVGSKTQLAKILMATEEG